MVGKYSIVIHVIPYVIMDDGVLSHRCAIIFFGLVINIK
jgi:hypothetical protein